MKITFAELKALKSRHSDKEVVYFDGVFDLIHVGHVKALNTARGEGDILVVGVMSDEWVKEHKGKNRPVMNLGERSALVDALEVVDYTISLSEQGERLKVSQVIQELSPDVYITSDSSWKEKFHNLNTTTRLHIAERILPEIPTCVKPISTTNIIKHIKDS